MINTFSIMVSLVCVVFVVYRAVLLDRTTPWFGAPPERPNTLPDGRRARRYRR